MKTKIRTPFLLLTLLIFVVLNTAGQTVADSAEYLAPPENLYYGADLNGVLTGYGEVSVGDARIGEKNIILIKETIHIKQMVLGGNVDTEIAYEYHVDPGTGQYIYCDNDILQATIKAGSTVHIEGNTAHFHSKIDGSSRDIQLPEDIILENSQYFPHLTEAFLVSGKESFDGQVLDLRFGTIQDKTFTMVGKETLTFNDREYETLVIKDLNKSTGVASRIWLDTKTAYPVQMELPNQLTIFLADKSVQKQITTANLDNVIFGKVDRLIPDILSISYMEVKAKIRTMGEWTVSEDLNVPNQIFEGTVHENLIDGVFKISHPRYDGKNAPAFPDGYSQYAGPVKYLEPEDFIESDHPDLVMKALEITDGASNSWDAAVRLSSWVSDHIEGAIPGGITALKVYETRGGECGGHSRLLTAFCRAVGIPARMVIGCMYTTYYGGSFGQHAWTEVFMGDEAGWIPVDATIGEVDYVDCGHIRLGEMASFNPVEMEILNYQVGDQNPAGEAADTEIYRTYAPYLGEYHRLENNATFTLELNDGVPVIHIPNTMPLALYEPDELGFWYAKLTNRLYFHFERNRDGKVRTMHLHQITPLEKKEHADSIANEIPEMYHGHLGTYFLPQLNALFEVSWRNGSLALYDPFEKVHVGLQAPDSNDIWMDEFNRNQIEFIHDENGEVTSLNILQDIPVYKGKLAVPIIREAINNHGFEAGVSQYESLKIVKNEDYLFSESDMNSLGYEFMNEGKYEQAIQIFKWNVTDHPNSWNVYDSLGEAYKKAGQTGLAIRNYRKSLELNPNNENGKKMLKDLGVEMEE